MSKQDTLFLQEETPMEKSDNEMNIFEKLTRIQCEMKVPKNLLNKFGNYNYRNAETILETAKPLCLKYGTTLTVQDYIEMIGDRYYVRAVCTLVDWATGETVSNQALARESEDKKGMDSSQVTGATSSYARKYALNGLFNLDDVKDADSMDNTKEEPKTDKKATDNQVKIIVDYMNENPKFVDYYNDITNKKPNELTLKEASDFVKAIESKKK